MVEENINLDVSNQAAKDAIQDVTKDIDELEKRIERISNARVNNNNTLSNKQVATAQGGLSDLYSDKTKLQQMLASVQKNGDTEVESDLISKLTELTNAINKISDSDNYKSIISNHSTTTTSSSAFRTFYGDQTDNVNKANADYNKLRSDVNNLINSNRKTYNNFEVGKRSGYISHNRYQEYKQSANYNQERFSNYSGILKKQQSKVSDQLSDAITKYTTAKAEASVPGASREKINAAREADEYVKQLEKVSQKLNQLSNTLTQNKDSIDQTNKAVNKPDNSYVIGPKKGSLADQSRYLARSGLTAAMSSSGSLVSQGSNARLTAFDNIKGVAYGIGGYHADNHVMDTISNSGYKYGYSGAEMSGFVSDYSGSTGNTGNYNKAATSWARQARITGSDSETTQSLEQSAGNASGLSGSQMSRLGNQITNEITSSGMTAKSSQQQQGLTELYNNATQYGASYKDLQQIAGLQGSLSSLGSQFQGTTGANNIIQATQTLSNYNSLQARTLFARGTGTKYSGLKGQAQLMQDMQDMNKNPASMSRVLNNAKDFAHGDSQYAAYNLSNMNPNVSMDTWEKLINANSKGKLDKSTLNKYLNDGSQAKKNDKSYSESGTSSIQKSNSALANSATKASESLDSFRSALAKIYKTVGGSFGGFGGVGMSVASAVGGSLVQGVGSGLVSGFVLRHGGFRGATKALFTKETWANGGRSLKNGGRSIVNAARNIRKGGKFTGLLRKGTSLAKSTGSTLLRSGERTGLLRSAGGLVRKAGIANLAFGAYDTINTLTHTKKGSKAQFEGLGKAAGTTAGSAGGAVLGSLLDPFIGPAGTIGGSIIGGWAGGKIGGLIGDGAHWVKDKFSGNHKKSTSKKSKLHDKDDWKILRSYNKMLDKAKTLVETAKSISLNGDNAKASDDSEKASGKGVEAAKSVAKKVGKELGVDPSLVFAQIMHETGGMTSKLANDGSNNLSGIKYVGQSGATRGSASPEGDYYAKFNSLDDYAKNFASILKNDGIDSSIKSVDQYATALKNHSYFTAGLGAYEAGMNSFKGQYANGGIRSFASGNGFISSQPTLVNNSDLFGEAGTEAFIPLNTSHAGAGLTALNDLAGVFGRKLVSPSEVGGNQNTTINPTYNINLTIQGGTDDPDNLAQTVANKVKEMLNQFEQQQTRQSQLNYFAH
ncbi:lysin [Lactobacillus phage LfeInf]|uniref:Lysin n=1 Tax=Lactobacillus phage LfeInf TaxID=1567484 RepID=A0A0A7NNW9_9CAUD|nr:tail associated lysin [Lactobacillus phage LfeInf]AIZ94634.1 lysin [Lactobacillus phage LfeInf]